MKKSKTVEFPSIERAAFGQFMHEFKFNEKYRGMRTGQAMFDYFKLDKISDQEALQNLYQKDGGEAIELFHRIFNVN